ncbi:UTRA domain-containing protein [Leucobacter coleopterorum]|uniref:UTRA domain-containing protein n=1 Tax=Leucobacter coleopterorum TaxID=2714933 RepID=A0ABX6JX81_9MICO|nr:UTRA domain-containing protein [Leucobacter coleopterorum]QIM18203.1 UTRA domain-containing protein [Leucobacter coleopterorum]
MPGQRVIEISRRLADTQEAEGLGIEPSASIVEVLRARYFDDQPVMLESALYPLDVGRYFLVEDLEQASMYQILREHGLAPVRAHNVIDAEGAGQREAKWLGVAEGSALLRVRRTSYGARGMILELATNRYLPNMANFTIDNAVDPAVVGGPQLSRSAAPRDSGKADNRRQGCLPASFFAGGKVPCRWRNSYRPATRSPTAAQTHCRGGPRDQA